MGAEDYSPLALAFIGDASFSLYVRRFIIDRTADTNQMQHLASSYVSATAQAGFVRRFLADGVYTEEELSWYKRGRNAKAHAAPRNASAVDYHCATGFETVWGLWAVRDDVQRMGQVWDIIRTIQGE